MLFRELDGEAVLLDLEGEYYYGLNVVGTRVWQLLEECATMNEVQARLLEEFEVEEEQLGADLERLADDLLEAGLLQVLTDE